MSQPSLGHAVCTVIVIVGGLSHAAPSFDGAVAKPQYAPCEPHVIPPNLIKACEQRREIFSKAIMKYFNPDFYNCTIDYFHHPKTNIPTPNYRVNLQSDVFGDMTMTERVATVDKMLAPMLVKPYRLTVNARMFASAEFHDNRAECEAMKHDFAKYLEESMKEFYPEGPLEAKMKAKLVEAFEPELCQVSNQSYRYDEPEDAETHFSVAVISNKFLRKTVKEAEEMVRKVLREELPLLKSVDIIADIPEPLPTLVPTMWNAINEVKPQVCAV
ncbi:hypothetical protein WDU94_011461 [Cyamophila willieti]